MRNITGSTGARGAWLGTPITEERTWEIVLVHTAPDLDGLGCPEADDVDAPRCIGRFEVTSPSGIGWSLQNSDILTLELAEDQAIPEFVVIREHGAIAFAGRVYAVGGAVMANEQVQFLPGMLQAHLRRAI